MTKRYSRSSLGGIVVVLALALFPASARAHCDTMDGPVVKAAQRALAAGDVSLVLLWVLPDDEPEIRAAFEHTLRARAASPAAREVADRWFFETLVRVHRAGEGAPYTGLKPAGTDLGPAVPAADLALESGSTDDLERVLIHALRDGLRAHFQEVMAHRAFAEDDVAAGRAYVAAYVPFVHYVEAVYEAASGAAHGHYAEPAAEHAEPAGHPR